MLRSWPAPHRSSPSPSSLRGSPRVRSHRPRAARAGTARSTTAWTPLSDLAQPTVNGIASGGVLVVARLASSAGDVQDREGEHRSEHGPYGLLHAGWVGVRDARPSTRRSLQTGWTPALRDVDSSMSTRARRRSRRASRRRCRSSGRAAESGRGRLAGPRAASAHRGCGGGRQLLSRGGALRSATVRQRDRGAGQARRGPHDTGVEVLEIRRRERA